MKCCGCLFQRNRQNVPDVEDLDPEEREPISAEVCSGQEQNQIVHSLLLERLDDLVDSELERFHSYLRHEPPQGYCLIPRSVLDGFNRTRTVHEMLVRHGREGAVEVMLYILGMMDLNEQAVTLQTKYSLHREALGPMRSPQLPVRITPAVRTGRRTPVAALDMETPLVPFVNILGVNTDRQPEPQPAVCEHGAALSTAQQKLKAKLKSRFQHIFEGVAKQGRSALLIDVYTKVFITEGIFEQVNTEHEVWNIESISKRTLTEEVAIECNKIFQPLTSQEDSVKRSVLTKGIAGIGKTVSVQKFILDWVKGEANGDIDFILPLPFRELNLMKDRQLSLLGLIQHYYPEMELCATVDLNTKRVLFIFDGLDECRLPLKFHSNETWYKVTEKLPLDVLLTNLIQGNLLPSCLLWITSRPAAASQIPPECIHRVTEVRGFNDSQKDEYFRKRFDDQSLANRIITHIKLSRSLHIMCHIPVFCWISATVLERLLNNPEVEQIPKTLTQMYTEFLRIQIMIKNQKYHNDMASNTKEMRESDKKMTVSLGKLAFQQLKEGRLIFYEQDLNDSGIDVNKTHEYSGLYTEIFEEETGPYEDKTYCFVHLSIQEYLAALSVYFQYACNEENPLNLDMTKHTNADGGIKLSAVLSSAVDKALECQYGRLDLFVRFLLGISLESKALSWLLAHNESCSQHVAETIKYLKAKISKSPSPERTINLFHCLNELHDDSLVKEIQSNQTSSSSNQKLSPDQCSALAYMLLMSEEEVDVLDLRMYNTTQAGYRRLLPVLKHSRKALLQFCDLTPALCTLVKDVLLSPTSLLREVDLGYNRKLGDRGCKELCAGLLTPHCKLQTLGLGDCGLTKDCCEDLVSILRSKHSQLTELDLRNNNLFDTGVTALSAGLGDSACKLQKLGLSGCGVTETGCQSLASALLSNLSHLRELDLSYNHPGDLGIKVLSAKKEDPSCTLETLNVDHCGADRMKPGIHKYDYHLTLDPHNAIPGVIISEGNRKVHCKQKPSDLQIPTVLLSNEALTERHYWEVEWRPGNLELGVAYSVPDKKIDRLGEDDQSWAICCDQQSIITVHNNKYTFVMRMQVQEKLRAGVYLDWHSGTLAFYKISPKGRLHLHTFHAKFTQPLYAAFSPSLDVPMTLC